ncbi:MAG: hypothetical protein FD145_721 [Candidatus Saganbacteria bacterium]|uniref:Uncharacterized protein n=1 Tax=Candidatus Saganbacteria bacterium TaxID=2575572 RepID=A0A833L1C4_UNCSA|nr:MAG: hypothetical protein FD145_721 [Candidatus Saganbacteria bacterium]
MQTNNIDAVKASVQIKPQQVKEQNNEKKVSTGATGIKWDGDKINSDNADIATLSSYVSFTTTEAQPSMSIFGLKLSRKTANAVIEAYKNAFRASRSHNLLLERFTQSMVANALVRVLSTMGISLKDIQNLQINERKQILGEIHKRLEEALYSKAMMDIVG